MRPLLAILTLALTLAFALAPLLSDFSGFATSQLPDAASDPPVQPAGYAFGIWGPIYLWLCASAVWGLVYRARDADWTRARGPLCLSLAIGVPWLWIAERSPVWATVAIWAMLIFALVALPRTPAANRWWLRGPVALYTGWLTAASFVSLTTVLSGYGIALDSYGWAFVGLAGTLGLAVLTYWNTPAPMYLVAVIWALIGICVTTWMDAFLLTALSLTAIVTLVCVMAVRFPSDFRG